MEITESGCPMIFKKYSKKVLKYKLPKSMDYLPINKDKELEKTKSLMEIMRTKKVKSNEIERIIMYIVTLINMEKFHLDWKYAYDDNNISELFDLYGGELC